MDSTYKKIRHNQISELYKMIEENFRTADYLGEYSYIFLNNNEFYQKMALEIEKSIYDKFKTLEPSNLEHYIKEVRAVKSMDKMQNHLKETSYHIIKRFKRLEKRDFNLKQKYKHAVRTIYEEYIKDRCKDFDIKIFKWEFSQSEQQAEKNWSVQNYCKELKEIAASDQITSKKTKMHIIYTVASLFTDGIMNSNLIEDARIFQAPKYKMSIKNVQPNPNNSGVASTNPSTAPTHQGINTPARDQNQSNDRLIMPNQQVPTSNLKVPQD